MNVEVRRQRADNQAREPADGEGKMNEQAKSNGASSGMEPFVEGGNPVEDLDPARHGDEESEKEKTTRAVSLMPLVNMWCPQTRYPTTAIAQGRQADGGVPEEGPAGEDRDDLADDPHGGQYHDVDGRVGIHPEEVLVQDRVAALGGVEEPDAEEAAQKMKSSVMARTGVASICTQPVA